jgi:hypothetical protein
METSDWWILISLLLCSSIDLYITVFLIGFIIHFGWDTNVPAFLNPLSEFNSRLIFGLLYCIEFIAEKIPVVLSIWTGLNVLVKPAITFYFLYIITQNLSSFSDVFLIWFCYVVYLLVVVGEGYLTHLLDFLPGSSWILTVLEDIFIAIIVINTI